MEQKKRIFGKYWITVGNYDWGCSVDKAVLTLEEPVQGIDPARLNVIERKMVTDESTPAFDTYEKNVNRTVVDAYPCDQNGERCEGESSYLAVELYAGPKEGSPLVCTTKYQIFIWSDPYELLFDYDGEYMLSIDPVYTKKITAADMFEKKSYTTDQGITYDYAAYSPEQKTDLLFVWLHGLGEGKMDGSDVYLPLLGRKGCTMAGKAFQETIGGAHILVPQCPTYWMDADGKRSNFAEGAIQADGTSYYTESLDQFIDWYAKKVGAGKIVLAGCSNGGYMTLMLCINHPEKYRAAVPICESVPDAKISDENIKRLTQVPLYFVYSKDDPIVVPKLHAIPTIERLKKAGCRDLHVSVTDHVVDTSGKYKDKDGNPYQYMGHLSWIYYDNNETDDGTGLAAWNWIAEKIKDNE